jgi:hypothetical protein
MSIKAPTLENHYFLSHEGFKLRKLPIYFGIACFIFSLFQTSLFTSGEDIKGYWVFIIGWLGLIIFQFSWFSNPLNLLALLLYRRHPGIAALLSILAFTLASQTFFFTEIPAGLNQSKIYIKELGPGFYFWYLSQGLFLVSIISEIIISIKTGRKPAFYFESTH